MSTKHTAWLMMIAIATLFLSGTGLYAANQEFDEDTDLDWSDGANWVGGVAPISTDQVLLDNSVKLAPYSVVLPSGAITTSIVRLTIAPAAFIILTLPVSNTAR